MFDYSLDYKNIDFRANPHLYRVGKGEQGVLLVTSEKAESASIFYAKYQQAKNDPEYLLLLRKHKALYEI